MQLANTAAYTHFINSALLYYSQIADNTSIIHGHSHQKRVSKYRWTTNIHATTTPNHAEQKGQRQNPQPSPIVPYYV